MKPYVLCGTLLLCAAALGGCIAADGTSPAAVSPTPTTAPADRAAFQKALAAAETARQQADQAGGEWRDTGSLLERAHALAAEGRFEEAVALADRARHESELAAQQAQGEQAAGPRFGPQGSETLAQKKEYDRSLAAAHAAERQARAVGNEWRDTASVLERAEAAAAEGDYEKAALLAKLAAQQSAMAYAQAKGQRQAGPHF